MLEGWPWPSRPWAFSQKWTPMSLLIIMTILENFEDEQGHDGHGHASK